MTDANAVGERRRGRRPKANKRVPLSLLLDANLRSQIVEMAEKSDCSITGQVERLLRQGIKTDMVIGSTGNAAPLGVIELKRVGLANNISSRAGAFLEIEYPGRSKDERIARDLGISAGMAKMLRQGRAWTVARLDQAMELWPGFRKFVFPPADELTIRLTQLADWFARLAGELEEVRKELRAERPLRVGSSYASPKVAAGRIDPRSTE